MKWQIIGWYSTDPTDTGIRPYPRIVVVEAASKEQALLIGEQELDKRKFVGAQLLNWYAKRA